MYMKHIVTLLIFMLSTLSVVSAQSASEWLAKLDASLGERYAMSIAVALGGEDQHSGFVIVDGDSYYMTLGVMEVYCDGKLRYEVNNQRKEVVEDVVNLASCDLLSNPTRAFDFVPEEFAMEVTAMSDSAVTLMLTPNSEDMGINSIVLTLARKGSMVEPTTISYDYDGEQVAISLQKLKSTDLKLRKWDKAAYRAYDIVSFL